MQKAKCPFCEGCGCCNCDHSGWVPFGESLLFKTKDEVETHDPGEPLFDVEIRKGYRDISGKLIGNKPPRR